MTGVALIEPLAVTFPAIPGYVVEGRDNLGTPSPREIARFPIGGEFRIFADLGEVATFDSIYLSAFNPPADIYWALYPATSVGGFAADAVAVGVGVAPGPASPPAQMIHLGAAKAGRYWLLILATGGASLALEMGAVIFGKRITHPYALGWGRQLIDTSRRTDLIDGGFGFEDGVTKAAVRWRFVDLDDAKRDALWSMFRRCGNRRPVVMVEDVEAAPISSESIHYGVLDRFEPWERANPAETQWALSLTEWR